MIPSTITAALLALVPTPEDSAVLPYAGKCLPADGFDPLVVELSLAPGLDVGEWSPWRRYEDRLSIWTLVRLGGADAPDRLAAALSRGEVRRLRAAVGD